MTNASGKVVLITGATDGLGKAAAILLAAKGYGAVGGEAGSA